MKTPDYVVGLMFNEEKTKVALIRKNKPEWQAGKLNGIGGSVEDYDLHEYRAMCREFEEETGMITLPEDWIHFHTMVDYDKNWHVYCFHNIGNINLLYSKEDEKIEIVDLSDITFSRVDLVSNLCWMIGMALDSINNENFFMGEAIYKN